MGKLKLGKRFMMSGRRVLFKSRIRSDNLPLGEQHYNQWHEIGRVPADMEVDQRTLDAVANAFVAKRYTPLTEDEVRACVFSSALTGDVA